jgi:hypothetical protein
VIPTAPDRRTDPRYTLELPLRFLRAEALTRNVSESGVYFETTERFHVQQPIHFAMVLGCAHPCERFVIECQARVLRVEPLLQAAGVAARITSYLLVRSPLTATRARRRHTSTVDAGR